MRRFSLVILVGLGCLGSGAIAQSKQEIGLTKTRNIEVLGLEATQLQALQTAKIDWESLFSLRVAQDGAENRPAIVGTYSVAVDRILFEPRFPLSAGLTYVATFNLGQLPNSLDQTVLKTTFAIPKAPNTKPTSVQLVSPSSHLLPENLLKFYIHFSAPMARGEIYERVHLLDSRRMPIVAPFLELGEELWDPSGTRVTILIDPGRIKRGLKPREEVGPVFEEGKTYTLVIDQEWLDARGFPLKSGQSRTFIAGPADSKSPDPATWSISRPRPDSFDPLEIQFPEPLDQALLHWAIVIKNRDGVSIKGTVLVADDGRSWSFLPTKAWNIGEYRLGVDDVLEDLAGNNVARPFEVDELPPVEQHIKTRMVERPIMISR